MMDYADFKETVVKKLRDYLPEQYRDAEVRVEPVHKVNVVFDGIMLVSEDEERRTALVIYIQQMYEDYLATGDLQKVLQSTARTMGESFAEAQKSVGSNFNNARDSIVFQVINTLQNEKMLEDVPHREFQDLSVIYRWMIKTDEHETVSCVIHNNFPETLGMKEEQLFQCAMENTRRLFPPTVTSMNDIIYEKENMPIGADEMPDELLWIISNESGIYGAGSMLYEDILYELASKLKTDLYILPSSLHEVIAVPADIGSPDALAEMVREVNSEQVALEDRLSNQVYYYDKDARCLSLATDTLDKYLDEDYDFGQDVVR